MDPRIADIEVHAVGRDRVFLQWQVVDLVPPWDRYRVQIVHSFSESGPWEQVMAPAPLDLFSFLHTGTRRNRWSPPFYRIELVDTGGPVTRVYPSAAVYPSHPADPKALVLSRRLESLLRTAFGVETFFLKKRIDGVEDPEAFNRTTQRLTGQAGQSYGQRFQGGFYRPIPLFAKLSPEPLVAQTLPVGTIHHTNAACWIAGRPLIAPGDLFVERYTNRRWRVQDNIHRQAWRQTIWRQLFSVEEIAVADPEYEVPVEERALAARP